MEFGSPFSLQGCFSKPNRYSAHTIHSRIMIVLGLALGDAPEMGDAPGLSELLFEGEIFRAIVASWLVMGFD